MVSLSDRSTYTLRLPGAWLPRNKMPTGYSHTRYDNPGLRLSVLLMRCRLVPTTTGPSAHLLMLTQRIGTVAMWKNLRPTYGQKGDCGRTEGYFFHKGED